MPFVARRIQRCGLPLVDRRRVGVSLLYEELRDLQQAPPRSDVAALSSREEGGRRCVEELNEVLLQLEQRAVAAPPQGGGAGTRVALLEGLARQRRRHVPQQQLDEVERREQRVRLERVRLGVVSGGLGLGLGPGLGPGPGLGLGLGSGCALNSTVRDSNPNPLAAGVP
eukprot:scaffold75665_cov42-Phaeocystis_antarctica.AAC.1